MEAHGRREGVVDVHQSRATRRAEEQGQKSRVLAGGRAVCVLLRCAHHTTRRFARVCLDYFHPVANTVVAGALHVATTDSDPLRASCVDLPVPPSIRLGAAVCEGLCADSEAGEAESVEVPVGRGSGWKE